MTTTDDVGTSQRGRDFIRTGGLANSAGAWLAAGFGLVLVAAAGMALAIVGRAGSFSLQFMTTVPILLSIGAFLTARSLGRSPTRVTVSDAGLRLEGPTGTRDVPWSAIAWAAEQPVLFSRRRQLVLLDASGTAIGRAGSDLADFAALCAVVRLRVGAQGAEATSSVRRSRLRKQAWLLCLVSPLMLLLAIANAAIALRERADEKAFATRSVETEARLLRRFVAPDGRTLRIEFEVADANGTTARRNVEVDDETYAALAEATTVPVLAVPGRPQASHVLGGEVFRRDAMSQPATMLVLSGLLGLFMLGLFAAGIAAFRGYEIDWNPTTRKLSVQRVP